MPVETLKNAADPIAGHATIDGITLRTDSLTDLRWDRVMPILLEEQVFMCHQMRPTVHALRGRRNRGLNILDLGAGSGVFGIYLDRQLNRQPDGELLTGSDLSAVVCLDVNLRAIRFVQDNAERNASANVRTQCERYSERSAAPCSQDVIVINPPYHPVYGHWTDDVALHGAAGEDGLGVFREWKDLIATHLNHGGLLIGSVMSPTSKHGTVVAMEELSNALGRDTSAVRFCRHLDDPDPSVEEFLKTVYADYLEKEPDLYQWIGRMTQRFAHFTVVYFETEKSANGRTGVREDLVRCRPNDDFKWRDRMQVHALMARKVTRSGEVDISRHPQESLER
ncbi:MAG: methyltransferase [bacterium]|nr:methyltransferase [bacterium]